MIDKITIETKEEYEKKLIEMSFNNFRFKEYLTLLNELYEDNIKKQESKLVRDKELYLSSLSIKENSLNKKEKDLEIREGNLEDKIAICKTDIEDLETKIKEGISLKFNLETKNSRLELEERELRLEKEEEEIKLKYNKYKNKYKNLDIDFKEKRKVNFILNFAIISLVVFVSFVYNYFNNDIRRVEKVNKIVLEKENYINELKEKIYNIEEVNNQYEETILKYRNIVNVNDIKDNEEEGLIVKTEETVNKVYKINEDKKEIETSIKAFTPIYCDMNGQIYKMKTDLEYNVSGYIIDKTFFFKYNGLSCKTDTSRINL
jgi:hypothetical protein